MEIRSEKMRMLIYHFKYDLLYFQLKFKSSSYFTNSENKQIIMFTNNMKRRKSIRGILMEKLSNEIKIKSKELFMFLNRKIAVSEC